MAEDKHFVDKHRSDLILRVTNVSPILDELLCKSVIPRKSCDEIRALATSQEKMRALLSGPLESSGVKGKDIFYEILSRNEPRLIDDLERTNVRVEMMTSVIELLLETLKDLHEQELKIFKDVLLSICKFPRNSIGLVMMGDLQTVVFSIVLACSQKSVNITKQALTKMKRTDLVQKLSDSSSGSKKKLSADEHRPAIIHKVASMAATKAMLLETLKGLSDEDIMNFRWFLQFTLFQSGFPNTSQGRLLPNKASLLVDVMVEVIGQQSAEMTTEVFIDMNRTDLVQRLSETSSGLKEKHSVDEDWPALIQKVETLTSAMELLLETLKNLSEVELQKFRDVLHRVSVHRCPPNFPLMRYLFKVKDLQDTVFLIVQTYSQDFVEITKEVLKGINRTDLVQMLSDSSSGPKKKLSADEHLSALIQRVATMAAVQQLLLETLKDLSDEELKKFTEFLRLMVFEKDLPEISSVLKNAWDRAEVAHRIVHTYGRQSVDLSRDVFMDMDRTDLAQRMSKPSSGLHETRSVDEQRPPLFERVTAVAAVKLTLLETVNHLDFMDFEKFRFLLQFTYFQRSLPQIPLSPLTLNRKKLVDLMVQSCGQQSVEVTEEVLTDMNRTDLAQRLSKTSSALKEKHPSTLLKKEVTMTSLQVNLLERLICLSREELEEFKRVLSCTEMTEGLPRIPDQCLESAKRLQIVELMVELYGQDSEEVMAHVFQEMNWMWMGMSQSLSEISSGSEETDLSTMFQKVNLLEALEDLNPEELEKLKWVLSYSDIKDRPQRISSQRLEAALRSEIMEMIFEIYDQQSLEVMREVLMRINRSDLAERLSEISLASTEGPSSSLEPLRQASTDWTELEPEVSSTEADEAPTYSLQSGAGHFECSISGLRWLCKEKVSFKYQFLSWEEHMERMEIMKYMPAGPLMDITVITGKLDEVHLPHWICIDGNPKILDKFAVLHIDDCGDVVEKASEVTKSHVKLSEPVFSPRAVLMKAGVSVRISCKVLIYKTNTAFLTLHVYLIPCDPGLQQAMDKRELSYGYKIIRKPHPEKSLKMRDRFILTADWDGAEIYPEKLKLRYESKNPNFFEVFIENPDTNFRLKLTKENEDQPVWTCAVRTDEYQSRSRVEGEHFVDRHQCDLIQRVGNVGSILDHLLREGVIQQEGYDIIAAIPTTQEKMRKLYSGPLKAAGQAGKDIFYKILKKEESYLVSDLKKKES